MHFNYVQETKWHKLITMQVSVIDKQLRLTKSDSVNTSRDLLTDAILKLSANHNTLFGTDKTELNIRENNLIM